MIVKVIVMIIMGNWIMVV